MSLSVPSSVDASGPSLDEIQQAKRALDGRIIATPMVSLSSDRIRPYLPAGSEVSIKLELFQHAGSFKARGALLSMDALDDEVRSRGVTALSAGNHALAVAWAANREGVGAKLVMPTYADPVRIDGCKALGADVVLVDNIAAAFTQVDRIVAEEGRTQIHPFEGKWLTLGTSTCGFEIATQQPGLDAVIVPVGGGGLISGVSRAVKLMSADCEVIGVEPTGADSLYRSFQQGEPVSIEKVDTIADSLGAPMALPYSFGVARANVDEIVRIDDAEMLKTTAILYDALKIAAEPACAASTAALIGPLRERFNGKRVAVIACGSNIGEGKFTDLLTKGRALLGAPT